jgi:hypothetical protein
MSSYPEFPNRGFVTATAPPSLHFLPHLANGDRVGCIVGRCRACYYESRRGAIRVLKMCCRCLFRTTVSFKPVETLVSSGFCKTEVVVREHSETGISVSTRLTRLTPAEATLHRYAHRAPGKKTSYHRPSDGSRDISSISDRLCLPQDKQLPVLVGRKKKKKKIRPDG